MRTITIDTGIDLSGLERDFKAVEKKIATLREKLQSKVAERDDLAIRMDEASSPQEADRLLKKWISADDAVKNITRDIGIYEQKAQDLSSQIAENTKETSAFERVSQKVDNVFAKFGKRIKTLATRVLFFSVLLKIFREIKSYFAETIKQNDAASQAVKRLKGAFQTLAQPLVNAVMPALVSFMNWLTKVVTAITMVIAQLTGKTLKDLQKSAKGIASAGKSASKSLASFDTINKLGNGNTSEIDAIFDVAELTQNELTGILTTIGLITAALLAWKAPFGGGLTYLEKMIGYLLVIAGLVIAVKNYFDAWTNGVNADNLLGIIGGLAIAMGGFYILLGPTAAGITAVVGGISLLVLGFKDIISNGANLANTLTVVAGIIMTGLGISILTGSLLPLLIAGIAAAVVALVNFGGEGQNLANGLKTALGGLLTFIKGVFTGDWNKAWEGLKQSFKGVVNSVLAIAGGLVNAIIKGLNWLISKINTISFTVPSWIPGVGGKSVGFHLSPVSAWTVPYLAEGAVIPPNREFLAVLGDQKQGTNIETPLSTMIEAFNAAMNNYGFSVDVNFSGDGAAIVKMLKPEVNISNKRRGK